MKASQDFGLSTSLPKTKVMAASKEVCSKDCSPIQTEHGNIDMCEIHISWIHN